jgi:hypothetical protein
VEGKSIFGGQNEYERELKRRIDTADELDVDLKLDRIKSKQEASERLKKELTRNKDDSWF